MSCESEREHSKLETAVAPQGAKCTCKRVRVGRVTSKKTRDRKGEKKEKNRFKERERRRVKRAKKRNKVNLPKGLVGKSDNIDRDLPPLPSDPIKKVWLRVGNVRLHVFLSFLFLWFASNQKKWIVFCFLFLFFLHLR